MFNVLQCVREIYISVGDVMIHVSVCDVMIHVSMCVNACTSASMYLYVFIQSFWHLILQDTRESFSREKKKLYGQSRNTTLPQHCVLGLPVKKFFVLACLIV